MARLKKGLFNTPEGQVGNVVFSSRNGVPYVRTRPSRYKDAKTPAQLASRARLSMLSRLLSGLKPAINMGFRDTPPGKSSRDVAYRANSKSAIKGEWPDLYVDYPSVIVSQGDLSPADEASVARNGNTLACTWTSPEKAAPYDRALLTIYDPEISSVLTEPFVAKRADEKADFTLPGRGFGDGELHVWLSFLSPDGHGVSPSVYAGLAEAGG